MREDGKAMQLNLEGAALIMQWPETISTENLEVIEEVLAIQLRSVRHTLERRKAGNQMPLELPDDQDGAKGSAEGSGS